MVTRGQRRAAVVALLALLALGVTIGILWLAPRPKETIASGSGRRASAMPDKFPFRIGVRVQYERMAFVPKRNKPPLGLLRGVGFGQGTATHYVVVRDSRMALGILEAARASPKELGPLGFAKVVAAYLALTNVPLVSRGAVRNSPGYLWAAEYVRRHKTGVPPSRDPALKKMVVNGRYPVFRNSEGFAFNVYDWRAVPYLGNVRDTNSPPKVTGMTGWLPAPLSGLPQFDTA